MRPAAASAPTSRCRRGRRRPRCRHPRIRAARPGRGVPDVAGDADPATGYEIYVGGATQTVGGTSAVAPLWAGLVALCNASRGKPVGFLGSLVYPMLGTSAFHDVTTGTNGAYRAGAGWDACTGLGTPDGTALLAGLH